MKSPDESSSVLSADGPISRHVASRERELRDLVAEHGAMDIRVFGSAARGEDRDDSDLDLLVRLGDDATLLTPASLQRQLCELLGVDVHVLTDGALAAAEPAFRARVLAEARQL